MADILEIVSKEAIQGILEAGKGIVNLDENLLKLQKNIDGYKSKMQEVNNSTKELNEKSTAYSKILSNVEQEQMKINASAKEMATQQKQLITTEAKISTAKTKTNKKLAEQKIKLQESNKEIKNQILLQQTQKGSLNRIERELADNIRKYKELTAAQRANKNEGGKLLKTIQQQDKAVKNLNAQLGRSQGHVGNYGRALQGVGRQLIGALGVTAGIAGFVAVLRNAGKVVNDFSKAQSELAALSGKTKEELKGLTEQALLLGRSTEFTASQATKAQVELVKLGLSVNEITLSTPEILKFASATGAELPEAAKTAAVAMRAFGLDASKMGDITAALAVSTTKSALSFADFDTILATLGPVAKSYGFTLEDTIDLTGKLKDAGFDASSAATATRNIMLNLADSNGKLAQSLGRPVKNLDDLALGLQELDAKGVDLAETLELTDKRSVAAFNTFLSGAGSIGQLRDSITGANAELDEMVEKRLDNLAGDVTKLKSAWEGFILSIEQGDGVLSKMSRGTIQFLTNALSALGTSAEDARKQANELSLVEFGQRDVEEFKQYIDKMESYGIKIEDMGASAEKFLKIDKERLSQLDESDEAEKRQIDILNNRISAIGKYVQAQIDARKAEEEQVAKAEAAELEKRQAAYESMIAGIQKAQEKIKISEPLKVDDFIEMPEEDFDFPTPDPKEIEEFARQNEIAYKQQLMLIRTTSKSEEEAAQRKFELDKSRAQSAIDSNKKLLESSELTIGQRMEIENNIAEQQMELDSLVYDHKNELREKEKEADEKRLERIEEIKEASINTANEIFNFRAAMLDRESTLLEQQKEAGQITEEEYAKKKAEIEIKQAKTAKAQGLFNAVINTAQAVTAALAVAPPFGFILAGLAGAMGAMQIASIASQPLPTIPAFAEGTHGLFNTPSTFLAGEAGTEIVEKNGKSMVVDKPTIFTNLKGARVRSNPETEYIMNWKEHGGVQGSKYDAMLFNEMKGLRKDIKNMPQPIIQDGRKVGVKQNNNTKKILNRYKYGYS